MRILDVGSGSGDVAFLAADLVGATGEVVGADRAAAAVQRATARAQARNLRNVKFLEGDPAEMRFDWLFDAVFGRLILIGNPELIQMRRPRGRSTSRYTETRGQSRRIRHCLASASIYPTWRSCRSRPPQK
jgi:SAM-dependent methyltransferase